MGLADQARTKTGAEANRLLAEAEDKIRQALVLNERKTYNLACSLRGRKDEALGELEKAHGSALCLTASTLKPIPISTSYTNCHASRRC